jgi:hypothetical protein
MQQVRSCADLLPLLSTTNTAVAESDTVLGPLKFEHHIVPDKDMRVDAEPEEVGFVQSVSLRTSSSMLPQFNFPTDHLPVNSLQTLTTYIKVLFATPLKRQLLLVRPDCSVS